MSSSKLLLADDSVTIQKVVNLTFADEGIEVISVGDGNSAMEKFVEISPDLVMADVNMPGIDGYRICEMIKQDANTKNVPVVLLVGSFEPFDEEEAKRVGANDYLTKPFQSIRQLVEKVSDLLSQSRVERISFAKPKETADVNETVTAATDSSVETIEPHQEKSADENRFGDAGMDDEMIQANQVGSLPVGEVQRFESPEAKSEEEDSDGFPVEFRDVEQHKYEISEGAAETKPLSSEEFREITAESGGGETDSAKEEIIYEPADHPAGADEPSFEETKEVQEQDQSPEAEDTFVPTIIPTEQYFQTDDTAEDEQVLFEETPGGKDLEIEAMSPDIPTEEEPVTEFEILDNEMEVEPESLTEPEIIVEKEPSQPGFIDKLRHIFRDKEEMTSIVDKSEPVEIQTTGEPAAEFVQETEKKQTPETEPEAEAPAFVSEDSEHSTAEVPEVEQEFEQAESAPFQAETSQPEVSAFEAEMPQPETPTFEADTFELETEGEVSQPEIIETEDVEFQPEEIEYTEETFPSETAEFELEEVIQPEPTLEFEEISESGRSFAEPEAEFEEAEAEVEEEEILIETADVARSEGVAEAEQEAVIEEKPISEKVEEKTEEKAPETAADEVEEKETKPKQKKIIDLDEANLLEITPGEKASPIKSMISSELREETPDSGESLIVSEYARQSISLSSEAIDMIADRVADKIAEKVIRELSSEVVSDLADLVVERMERKKLE